MLKNNKKPKPNKNAMIQGMAEGHRIQFKELPMAKAGTT